ncbi:MAG: hypothetical protein KDK65_01405 [Chlamydiia bacterium]|nr:hypothetical protein [Chlamydiia bacterium]
MTGVINDNINAMVFTYDPLDDRLKGLAISNVSNDFNEVGRKCFAQDVKSLSV